VILIPSGCSDILWFTGLLNANPDRYHVEDGLHLSGEGCRLWFEQLVAYSPILESLRTTESSRVEQISGNAR